MQVRTDDLIEGRASTFTDLVEVLSCRSTDEVPAVLRAVQSAVEGGHFAAGYVTYEAASGLDRALVTRAPGPLPLVCFGIYRRLEVAAPLLPPADDRASEWCFDLDQDEHARAVSLVKEEILEGRTYQVNLTARLTTKAVGDPFSLYRQLVFAQQSPYNLYLEDDRFAIACASPELFFELDGCSIRSRPMKGTAARGRFGAEDRALAAALAASPKERAENLMIVDLVRNDLGRLAETGSVEVPELFSRERYPTVWQLSSEVRATLRDDVGLAQVFAALFPCGSVTGAPKRSTMQLISELEGAPRGAYCGAIGTVLPGPSGLRARFAVGIRTAVVDKTAGITTYGAGGGITIDSDPVAEWNELCAKVSVISHPPTPPGLLETFRYEPGSGFVNLERHLQRLAASADYFDLSFSKNDALELLETWAMGSRPRSRVRLTLRSDKTLDLDDEPFPETSEAVVRLAVDDHPVDSSSARLFHKTTDRQVYAEALARHRDADDVILCNERGEVTETTRANLAVEIDGAWLTPPACCGLLPGVERGRLLELGIVREEVITIALLERASAIATVSSLRGWRMAKLQ